MPKQLRTSPVWPGRPDARVGSGLRRAEGLAPLVPRGALDAFLDGAGALLGRPERRAAFALYALGLLGGGERKSAEPIAARAAGGDALLGQRYHDRLCHFLNSSRWDDRAVRAFGARYALAELPNEGPEAWLIDEVCFPKQGAHSPGVQRQYSRAARRALNCQLAVGLTLVARGRRQPAALPVGLDLYLPEAWANDPQRRRRAKVAEGVRFRTGPEIALELLADAARAGLPTAPVLADASYGSDEAFREGLTRAGLPYALEIEGDLALAGPEIEGGVPTTARELARALPAHAYRRVSWCEGDEAPLASRFARARVRVGPAVEGAGPTRAQELLIERPEDGNAPACYVLATLPAETTLEELVRLTKLRGRSARAYADLKEGLGLDHFEGRTYLGWQHHVSVVLACYALVLSCQGRAQAAAASEAPPAEPVESAA